MTTNITPSRGLLAELAVRTGRGGEVDPDDQVARLLPALPVDRLVEVKHLISEIRRGVGQVARFVDRLIAQDVQQNGAIRLGDSVYQAARGSDRRVLEGMGQALFDWLGDDLRRCVNPSDVKITGVRTVAELRGESVQAVEDTFYQRTLGTDWELEVLPVSRRKWAEALADGERRLRRET